MIFSFSLCSITPNIWGTQKDIVSIGENEKKANEKRIAHWNIVNHFLNR